LASSGSAASAPVLNCGVWQFLAAGAVEQGLAGQHLGVVDRAARRHAEVARVEQHLGEDRVAYFRLAAMRLGEAFMLSLGAAAAAEQATAQAQCR